MRAFLLVVLSLLAADAATAQRYDPLYDPTPRDSHEDRPFSRDAVLIDVFQRGDDVLFTIDGQSDDQQHVTSLSPGGSLVLRMPAGLRVLATFEEVADPEKDPLIGIDTIDTMGALLVAAQVNDPGQYVVELLVCTQSVVGDGCSEWTPARPAAQGYEGTGFVLDVSRSYASPGTGGGARPVRD